MWFVFALITFFAWGAADLFYKKGNDEEERFSHLKTSIIVGVVMGITAIATIFIKDIDYDLRNLYIYLPVSAMYILSMTVGYFGLRYLEVSVSSPIQNASGAVSALLLMIVLHEIPDFLSILAIILITAGVVLLGVIERKKELEYYSETGNRYKIGLIAFMMPILYCFIDSLGTFLDGYYLDDFTTTPLVGVTADNFEDVANISYELTFFIVAVFLFIFVRFIKQEKIAPKMQKDRLCAALFETAGQYTYVYALAGNGIVAAPMIASYCVASVIFARVFIKEKLSKKQYCVIALVFVGILLLGIVEGLEEG